MTHHGRHTLTPADNNGRTRKPKSKKKREDRYEEEIQYNLTYNFRGASARREGQSTSRMREDGEYPPPPAYETATAVSTLVSEDFVHQSGPPHPVLSTPTIAVSSIHVLDGRFHPGGSDISDTSSIDTASLSSLRPHSEEDGSSIELVDLDPSERWEMERQRGVPLDERIKRHNLRGVNTATPSPIPHRTRLVSQPTTSRTPGSHARFLASQLSLRIPEDHDQYDDDRTQDNSDISSPPTPKHHRMPSIPGSPSRFFHVRSHSPQPSSSVISLLRNPSPFFKSTPSLLNLSPSQHGGSHRSRTKLFHRKSKERASSEPLEDWEVLERTGSGQSSMDGSLPPPSPPVTPQNLVPQPLPRSRTPDVFVDEHPKLAADRGRKINTVQIPQTVGPEMHRPASPPFVARHVRRHTTSSRGGQMGPSSAPVSPVSISSASTFSASTISLSQNTISSEDVPMGIQGLANWEYPSESRSLPRALTTRGYEPALASRTPRVSSPAPPTIVSYDHDPDMPLLSNPGYGSLPARSATERIVRVSDARDENYAIQRGRSLSREMGMRSAPAYSSIFPSGPPTPLPNMSHTLPPPSNSPSPRHHYPGRPLPATPPVSPSLTWILDKGATHVIPHPKALVSAAPSTPPIPEGLLIDLDDDSLDTMPPGPSNPITPLCLGLLDDDEDGDNDNVSDSGTISPPGPLTPTTSGYASASSISLSTIASRSVESFDTSMQTTPTSEVPDINGLVSRLGDQAISDGSDYDALLLISDFIGPANPQPPSANSHAALLSPYFIGNVELERRRVTKDGRVKLKMTLLGVSVDKCAICMSQFKEGDRSILGAQCKHAILAGQESNLSAL
ncbi:hypothetical protein HYDPIDRAFT_170492 [Hydnomerulius pinastri MD-312]|uniref:Uncharacterized protein n=1 Tax=Hydnomerulius pinastri MD-312 TaxID=994086 RepID=A0A0C9W1V8_9AGAM|nr:hypothetical protein HYDPIDRAFT_170492 [Hydnomerulius pinastri MD-312]